MNIELLKDATITIEPGKVRTIRKRATGFALLSTSSDNLALSFDGGDIQTNYFPQGIAYSMPDGHSFDKVDLKNTSDSLDLTITFYVYIGKVYDNRINIVSQVEIIDVSDSLLMVNKSGTWTFTPEAGVRRYTVQATGAGVVVGESVGNKIYPIANGAGESFQSSATLYGTGNVSIKQEYDA
ncbi:MAG: hypothetical protein NE327_06345 [Lentisphaeraceae bacterium]|nr:hypothetical protein [Lentisphaeraceae bacterium]